MIEHLCQEKALGHFDVSITWKQSVGWWDLIQAHPLVVALNLAPFSLTLTDIHSSVS